MSDLTEAPRLPSLQAGGTVKAIVPQDFDGAWRIAVAVCKAGMAPRGLEEPEKAMVAIMHGLEVGLTPMAALQSIAVVNGRPTIWGDGALGLVRGSGKCEFIKERIDGDGDNMVAICEVKRKGEDDTIRARFSVADAKKANLWAKSGPWQQYPKRMLAMRARAFALRDGFADVLRGLGIAEEVQDYQPIKDVTPHAPPAPPKPPMPPAPPAEVVEDAVVVEHEDNVNPAPTKEEIAAAETVDENTGEVIDDNTFFQNLEDDMAVCLDLVSLQEVWNQFDPMARFTGKPQGEINQGIAMAIFNRAKKRVGVAA